MEEARKGAVRDAVRAARQQADELANLSGRKIGRVVAMQQGIGSIEGSGFSIATPMLGVDAQDQKESSASNEFRPLNISVAIEMQFALVGDK
jgi:uncharacterized protein YggE